MSSLFGLVLLSGALITVEAERDFACPSAEEVRAALAVRLPGAVAPPDMDPSGTMRLRLLRDARTPILRLYDAEGLLRLERALEGEEGPRDCAALADAVAVIVDRHLSELQVPVRAPPPAAPPRAAPPPEPTGRARLTASLRGRWRSGRVGGAAFGSELVAGRSHGGPGLGLQLEVALGAALPARLEWGSADGAQGAGERQEAWFQAAAGPFWRRGGHGVAIRATGAVAVLHARRDRPDVGPSRWGTEPWVALEALYRWHPGGSALFVEACLALRTALVRHQLVLAAPPGSDDASQLIQETPRTFVDLGFGGGFAF